MSRDIASRLVRRLYGIVVILGKPKSRGSIALASSDPRAAAIIDPAYLADAADRAAMVEGIRRARAIAAAGPLKKLGNREVLPGAFGRSTAGTGRFLENNIMTTYHYAGTCRMGDDDGAVVDRRLQVRGVHGLRVADASAIPEAPVSALNAPSMLLGFRAARFAREARGAS